jgi:hypothetical protein
VVNHRYHIGLGLRLSLFSMYHTTDNTSLNCRQNDGQSYVTTYSFGAAVDTPAMPTNCLFKINNDNNNEKKRM